MKKSKKNSKREKPPGRCPAANALAGFSALDGVGPLAVLALGGGDASPSFFPTVPDRNPRTLCGCQPVAFISSLAVAPPGRFSRSSTLAALLPSRAPAAFLAPLGAFLAGLDFLPRLSLLGRHVARTFGTAGLLGGFRSLGDGVQSGFQCFCGRDHDVSPLGGDYRGHDMDHSEAAERQANSRFNWPWGRIGDWRPDGSGW